MHPNVEHDKHNVIAIPISVVYYNSQYTMVGLVCIKSPCDKQHISIYVFSKFKMDWNICTLYTATLCTCITRLHLLYTLLIKWAFKSFSFVITYLSSPLTPLLWEDETSRYPPGRVLSDDVLCQ